MQTLKSIDTLLAALETWRCGTPSRAAQNLAVAPSSIYRAIDRLEAEVGTPLFLRDATGWRSTPAGQEVRRLAETMETELRRTELALIAAQQSFPAAIRITASDSIADYLSARLPRLNDRGKQLPIELIVENQFVDLLKRHADIAIRPDKSPGESLYGLRAGHLAHALYGATRYLQSHGPLRNESDLAGHKFCALASSLAHFTAARWLQAVAQRQAVEIALIANTELTLARGVEAGIGLAVLPCFVGDSLSGIERLPIAVKDDADIWIVTHPALRENASITRLIRALAKTFRADAMAFAGRKY